jgi:hypothetical protein
VVAGMAGTGIWLAYLTATIGTLFVATVPPARLFDCIFIGLIWLLAYRDIRISAQVGL